MSEPDELTMALEAAFDGGRHAVSAVEKYLASLNRWIPVSERLPPFREEVLTFGAQRRVIGFLADDGVWCSSHCDNETGEPWLCDPGTVTHWMPLPPPPATPPAPPT